MGTVAPIKADQDLGFLLAQASHVLGTQLAAGLAETGVSPRHYCVMSHAMQGEFTQIRLAELCGLDKTTMVITIDELERGGFAERRPCSTDRRARIIVVTPAGEQKVADARTVVAGIYDDILASLPDNERDIFLNGLVTLVNGRLSTPAECDRAPRRRSPKA
jgi:MarR family transcriptional regulator, transcriptional regulator for hemolysin